MSKEKSQIGSSWEDLAFPEEIPEPFTEGRAEQEDEEEEDTAANDSEEDVEEGAVKCRPKLLRMLEAAESRWTPQTRDRRRGEPSETGLKDSEEEAVKTNMVSKCSL